MSHAFVVRTNHVQAEPRLRELLEPFEAERNGGPVSTYSLLRRRRPGETRFIVRKNDEVVARSDLLEIAIDQVVWAVHDDAVTESRRFLTLHAAAAAWGGRGIVFPAAPNCGKSTLVAALVLRGLDFLSDEYAVVDLESGSLQPYPRPLWLDRDSLARLEDRGATVPDGLVTGTVAKHFLPAGAIRVGAVGAPCRVRLVVVPDYDPEEETQLEPMSRGGVLMQLADESFNFEHLGLPALEVLRGVLAEADCYRLTFSDLDEAVDAVRGLVGA